MTSAAEKTFCEYFQLEGKERKAMSGRGYFRKEKHRLKAQGGREVLATTEARALKQKAEAYATQARRLKHTADRAKVAISNSITDQHREELKRQNQLTLDAIAKHFVDRDDTEEAEIQQRLEEVRNNNGVQGVAVGCTYLRAHKWYDGKATLTKGQAHKALIRLTTEQMQDKNKGVKAMSCALSTAPSRPLMHATRDRIGPAGQKIGTITTDPGEVDGIAIRAWKTIYNGNVTDLVDAVRVFKAKYVDDLFFDNVYKLKPIGGKEFMETCTQGKHSSPGLDNWEPAEFALLSIEVFDWFATLLNRVEAGSPWPEGL